jgi:ABC-2 type transport system permease protein
MKALFIRILCQIRNDRRTMALMLLAPLFVVSLLYLMLDMTPDAPPGVQLPTYFEGFAYIFLVALVFMFTFIVSGMTFVGERMSGTLERMLMTPVHRFQVAGGYILAYGLVAVIQTALLLLLCVYGFGIQVKGSVLLCACIMFLLAIVAVEMGSLVSIFAGSEFQVAQFIPILIVPQIFFTGLIPLDRFPYHLGNLCYIMPMYYAALPIEELMKSGSLSGNNPLWVCILLLWVVALFIANTLSLKRYRKL